jgi:peptidoglycan/xylan/chitin deacetylase (PgdA/CDA1 family)
MYHRVADVQCDPWGLCVSPGRFAEHLAVVRERGRTLGLESLLRAHHAGEIPHGSVVITFDDGYADNLYNAKPLLEHYDVPATVFITTGQVGRDREFWWDELERLLLVPRTLPETLDLTIGRTAHGWKLGEACRYDADAYRRDCHRRPWQGDPGSRLAFYYAVWTVLRPLSEDERGGAIDAIAEWTADRSPARASHRTLREEELLRLAEGGLVEIGSHTMTHPPLPAHPAVVQEREIVRSKAVLEKILGRSVTSFAYPYGEFSRESSALVRAAGFTSACSVHEDSVWKGSDPYQLPRLAVEDWSGAELERRLTDWFER